MSRRARAAGFLALAVLAAAAAATIAAGYGASVSAGYGPLRPVVVAEATLPAGTPIDPASLDSLGLRRVPRRFAPPGSLASPAAAVGLEPAGVIPAGAYVLAGQLRPARRARPSRSGLGRGRSPVQITVSGADPALSGGDAGGRPRVDVIVVEEPGDGPGRARVAARAVPLLAIGPAPEGGTGALATLGLTRSQALRLLAAESFARKLTLIPRR